CKICRSVSNLTISEFMKRHAHGIALKYLPDCQIVKHHGGRKIAVKFPSDYTFFLKDEENGDSRRRKIRIWFTGVDYGYSIQAATN
ncbi:hypothetical protein LCGC14_3147910, partial [marine sediment metagenome]